MNLLSRLEKNLSFWILTGISFLFFLLRFPSLFEPDWYGDEGIYQALGLGINAGRLLYRDIFDNKPPLLYILYSLVHSDLFLIRLMSLIAGLLALWGFYYLSKKILSSNKSRLLATTIFAILFGLPLIEGNIANAENFMLLPNILAAILILKTAEDTVINKKLLLLLASGLILGVSFLLKIVAIFDFAAFFIFIFIISLPVRLIDLFSLKYLTTVFKKLFIFISGFILPILLTTIYFVLNNSLTYFLKAVLFNNVGYVGYGNTFIIPQGLLIIKLLLLLIVIMYLLLKRDSLNKNFIFISLWLSFSIFDTFFSQRPYTHYVLVLLPSFCLMLGFMMLNNKESKLAGILALSTLIIVLLNFRFYSKTAYYYQNFISFMTNNKSIYDYRRFFDGNTPRDYEISDYILIHSKTNKNTFIWGNNAQVYSLIDSLPPGRYTVAYHITNYKDGYQNTEEGLKKNPPQFIVVMPNVPKYPFNLSSYNLKINLNGVDIYEKNN